MVSEYLKKCIKAATSKRKGDSDDDDVDMEDGEEHGENQ